MSGWAAGKKKVYRRPEEDEEEAGQGDGDSPFTVADIAM